MEIFFKILLTLFAFELKTSSAECTNYTLPVPRYVYRRYDELDLGTMCENLTNLNEATQTLGGKALKINNSNLSSSHFSELPKQLETLKLSNTVLPEFKENTFDGFDNLTELFMEHANISSLDDNLFNPLINLETLNLNHNKLTKLNNRIFNSLQNLKNLYLANNNLSVIEDGIFYNCGRLAVINLAHNQLDSVDNLFSSVNSLLDLDVTGNHISKIPSLNLDIETLQIGENELKSLNGISKLNKLEYLNASNNYLDSFDDIGTLHRLVFLHLSFNNIEALNKSVIANLTKLHFLDLSQNLIKHIKQGTFQGNSHLYKVNFSHNYLEKFTYDLLPASLHVLDMSFNKLRVFRGSVLRTTLLWLEGNILKCKDLMEYKSNLLGYSYHAENINGVDCFDEEIEDDKEILSNSYTISIVNIILGSVNLVVLFSILLLLYFKSSYRKFGNAKEFSENL